MTSSNVMEVITKGSYDVYETADSVAEAASKSSTSHTTRPDSQLSLEYLPPEAPFYTASLQDQAITDSDDEVQAEASTELYKRILTLTDQVHSELDTMLDLDTISSQQSTPGPTDEEQVPLHELNPSLDSGIFTTERSPSAMNVGDLVPVLDEEDNVVRDCDSTLTASSEPSIDPKIKKAIDKMKRLDEKLADLEKKEKEVKKQRKLLEQQADVELHTSSTHSLDEQKYPPVFKTQLNDNTSTASDAATNRSTKLRNSAKKKQVDPDTEQTDDIKAKPKTQVDVTGTNFIQRNIELACDAGALVAMTETEKQRLDELLGEEDEEKLTNVDDDKLCLCVRDVDEGFSLKQKDLDRMRAIDSQLQAILPPSDWESLSCSSRTSTLTPPPSTQGEDNIETTDASEDPVDKGRHIVPGEEVLHQFQMSRTESERLKAIDDQLRTIQSENELALPLPSSELQDLLSEQGYIHTNPSQEDESTEQMNS